MPTFFDHNSLTADQICAWPLAIEQYRHVLAANSNRAHDTHSVYKRQHTPGQSKSALFNRLLEGKEPLPSPPPTKKGYPWYDVIEASGAHPAEIDGFEQRRSRSGPKTIIKIHGCDWNVKVCNKAAQRLTELNALLRHKQALHTLIQNSGWQSRFIAKVKAAYADGPEFIVQYRNCAEFALFVGQRNARTPSVDADQTYHHAINIQENDTRSVFNLNAMLLRARIEEALAHGLSSKRTPWQSEFQHEWLLLKIACTDELDRRIEPKKAKPLVFHGASGPGVEAQTKLTPFAIV